MWIQYEATGMTEHDKTEILKIAKQARVKIVSRPKGKGVIEFRAESKSPLRITKFARLFSKWQG